MLSQESEATIFQRLSFGQTYGRALAVFQERWDFFLTVGFMIFLPYCMFMITYLQFLGELVVDAQQMADQAAAQQQQQAYGSDNYDVDTSAFTTTLLHIQGELGKIVFEIALYMFLGIIGGSAMARAVAEIYAGHSPQLGACLTKGFQRFCKLFCATWIVGAVVALGYLVTVLVAAGLIQTNNGFLVLLAILIFIAFFVAVTYLYVAMMLATPVVMVENKGPIDTIKRCWELANNNRCFIFCTLFIFMFAYSIAAGIVFSIIFSSNPLARFSAWGAVVQTAPMILVLPATVILSNIVYFNIRIDREGMNRDVLLRDLGDGRQGEVVSDYSFVAAEDGMAKTHAML